MPSESPESGFADGPFQFVETPAHSQNLKHEPTDQFVLAASLMAVGHNGMTRGLNSIYLQAPLIKPHDYEDFIQYALCWHDCLDAHHHCEEEEFFPKIEALTGEKGIMDQNIKQHDAFLPPLTAYKSYLESVSKTPKEFSGKHLNTLIDAFAPSLFTHLGDEIPTLLALSRFGAAKVPLADIWLPIARKSGVGLDKTGAFLFFFLNLDYEFEDGLWRSYPPVPPPVRAVIIRLLGWRHRGWWRFASCGYDGKMQRLYAYK